MRGIIDRFEQEICVIEMDDGNIKNISRSLIPVQAKEGDFLIFCGDEILIDEDSTKVRKQEIQKLMDELFRDE